VNTDETLRCPNCSSNRLYRDGKRYTADGFETQRWLCRDCGNRFAEKPNHYKEFPPISKQHVCVVPQDAKNMQPETETKTVPGEQTSQDTKGKLVSYAFYMEKQGYQPETVRTNEGCLRALLKRNANLLDPESVKEALAKEKAWSENRKRNVINAYTLFLKTNGLAWEKPKCNVTRKIPFIPTEAEIDSLIAGCPTKLATFIQLLKETAMRSGEAIRLLWTDLEIERRLLTLNRPEKNSLPRQWNNLSQKLLDMLNALPRTDSSIFGPGTMYSLKGTFGRSRRRLSVKLQNPRLLQIHFHTMRHWKATMIYHKTKDLLYTMQFLGHKKSDNTLLYVQLEGKLFSQIDDEFTVRAANDVKGATMLAEVGFEPFDVIEGVHLYRKRK